MLLRNLTWILVVYYVKAVDDLGSCFGVDMSCESSKAIISGEFHDCRVLKRFSTTTPTKLVYKNGEIYIRLDDLVYRYDYETSDITMDTFKIPRPLRKIRVGDKTFMAGLGRTIVTFDSGTTEDDYLDVVTIEEDTVDEIDNFEDRIFIIPHKNQDAGPLYVIAANNLIADNNAAFAEVVENVNENFTSLAVDPARKELLLLGKDALGGKLISISLIKSGPCPPVIKTHGRLMNFEEQSRETFVRIVKEAEQNLTELLEQFISHSGYMSSANTEALQSEIMRLKQELRKTEDKLNKYKNKLFPSALNYPQSRPVTANWPIPSGSPGSLYSSMVGSSYSSSADFGGSGGIYPFPPPYPQTNQNDPHEVHISVRIPSAQARSTDCSNELYFHRQMYANAQNNLDFCHRETSELKAQLEMCRIEQNGTIDVRQAPQ